MDHVQCSESKSSSWDIEEKLLMCLGSKSADLTLEIIGHVLKLRLLIVSIAEVALALPRPWGLLSLKSRA